MECRAERRSLHLLFMADPEGTSGVRNCAGNLKQQMRSSQCRRHAKEFRLYLHFFNCGQTFSSVPNFAPRQIKTGICCSSA
jgi:hypothetical protein